MTESMADDSLVSVEVAAEWGGRAMIRLALWPQILMHQWLLAVDMHHCFVCPTSESLPVLSLFQNFEPAYHERS
jgi:hypothetical protein